MGRRRKSLRKVIGVAVLGVLTLAILAGRGKPVDAAELIMFSTASCTWCRVFETEVGVVYHKTPEARVAPLRRVDLAAARPPELAKLPSIRYTPTFVLMDRGREVGRILGYPGEAHFWGLLGRLLKKLPSREVPDAKLLDLTTEFRDDGRNEVDAPS